MSDIVKLALENAGSSTLKAGVATFGQVFLPGEVPAGAGLIATTSGGVQTVQLDVKTWYPDGSVKMAVLSIERPDIAAGGKVEVTLGTGSAGAQKAIDLAQALQGHSFSVDVNVHGGAHSTVDVLAALQKALAAGTASVWQDGSLATQARVEIPLEGSQRMIFDVTAYKGGGFSVEAQFNNDRVMEAQGGRVTYDVVVNMDGKQALQETVSQSQYQNWHESFSSTSTNGGQGLGSPDAGWLNIRQDIAHLQAAGAVAAYDLGLTIDPAKLASYAAATEAPGWGDPLASNAVSQYMPMSGGRADIGFTTEANVAWLISQDPRAAAYALGQAEAASAVPWNFWDKANGGWLSTDDYPKLWTDGRGGTGKPGDPNSSGLTQQVDNASGWTVDVAHQPDLSFVPYLLTGERWMLDNLQAQASASIMGQWPTARGGADDNVIYGSQVRGAAWALRQVDEAAWAAPDGSAEKAYFQSASDANYAYLVSKIPEWTALQGEAHGWVPGTYGTEGALPPWQQDYFASTVIAAASRGNADALTFLNWEANFLVGRFTHASEGFDMHDGAAYLIAISEAKSGGAVYDTWEQIAAETDARGFSNDNGWAHSDGDYAQLALATLSGIYRLTGSLEAKAAYDALIADHAPYSTAYDFANSPTYAIAAPGKVVGEPSVPSEPNQSVPPPTAEHPTVPEIPSETDAGQTSLAVVLGGDSWQGDPLAAILVDGQEVFRGYISAPHGSAGQRIELGNVAANAEHSVTVKFLNDGWGGSLDLDRNLYVEGVLVNGVSIAEPQSMFTAGDKIFSIAASQPKPDVALPRASDGGSSQLGLTQPSQTAPDVLRLSVSGDAWQGDPHFLLFVDGVQMGGERSTSASHSAGQSQVLEILGNFGGGDHELAVRFLNDAWGGSADTDRNLYVDKVEVNGVDQHHQATLNTYGDAVFSF